MLTPHRQGFPIPLSNCRSIYRPAFFLSNLLSIARNSLALSPVLPQDGLIWIRAKRKVTFALPEVLIFNCPEPCPTRNPLALFNSLQEVYNPLTVYIAENLKNVRQAIIYFVRLSAYADKGSFFHYW